MAENHAVLNEGEENEMEIFGYKSEKWRNILCIFGYIFSLGFLKLLFYWKPELDVWCHCVPCNLANADTVLLQTEEIKDYIKKSVILINLRKTMKIRSFVTSDENSYICKSIMEPEGKVRYIQVQKVRYVWIPSESKFIKIGVLEKDLSCSDIHSKYSFGLIKEEQEVRQRICGLNTITVKITPVWKLLSKEVFNPFYVFQAYSLCIWLATSYYEYSFAILFMTILSISATVYNLRKQSVKLHRMSASYNSILVSVLHKNGELTEVQSQSLVPGDVIVLEGNKLFLPCDAILISGVCTVNEAMLTGESIPVIKTPLPNINNSIPWMAHSGDDYKKHVLFCGTEVIQTKRNSQDLVKAVVLQTVQTMEFSSSQRNNKVLNYLGFEYLAFRTINAVVTWRCRLHRSIKCHSIIKTKDGNVVQEPTEHCHDSCPQKAVANVARSKMREDMRAVNATPRNVMGKVLSGLSNDVLAHMPRQSSLARSLLHHRTDGNLPIPKTIKFDIPEKYSQLLLHDSGKDDRNRILVLGDRDLMLELNKDTIYGGGTFDKVPNMFYQLYTWHAKVVN